MTDELAAVSRAMLASLEAGCDVIEEPWGAFVVSAEFHLVHIANFVWLRGLPAGGLREVLDRADERFAPYKIAHRMVYVEDALADRLRPELTRRGYAAHPRLVMVARRPPTLTANPEVTLRPARDQATRDDHDTVAGLILEEEGYNHDVSHQLLSLHWRRSAALDREVYVAYLTGEPAGNVGLDDVGGVGLIYNLETVPALRHRGVAATMLLDVRKRAQGKGLAPLGLDTAAADTTWQMYERLGFDRIGTVESFLHTR